MEWWRGHIIGLMDRHGIMICEGFILQDSKTGYMYQVIWDQKEARFVAASKKWLDGEEYKNADMVSFYTYRIHELEIIGVADNGRECERQDYE